MAEGKGEKKGAAVTAYCREVGASGDGGGTSRERERAEEEGKADSRRPLISCPGGKVKGRAGVRPSVGWAGGARPGSAAALREGRKEEESWAGLWWRSGRAGPCSREKVG
jgi:hypothetical protein